MLKQNEGGEVVVTCEECDEVVPMSQSVLRHEGVRLCWMCYTDEIIGRDPKGNGNGSDEDDDDYDDWDDDEWDDIYDE